VLIPARNEESNIRSTLEAVLLNHGVDFEVIVLDDHSTDRTAAIVSEFCARDSRVRLECAPPLPARLVRQTARLPCPRQTRPSNRCLSFMDADVRLAPDALRRMAKFMEPGETEHRQDRHAPSRYENRGDTWTVVQEIPTPLPLPVACRARNSAPSPERLLLPLIHFILLGFLPMHAMRRTRWPSMSAGCGQLFIARRDAYERCGGHAKLRDSLHDGIKLPRVFRKAGFRTDLFDATDLATCRMYHTNAETWRGLGKNATEGIAAPARSCR
jgi:glycosyltransferase involved in cell wall biosynthesis